jgi:hypothetical protein
MADSAKIAGSIWTRQARNARGHDCKVQIRLRAGYFCGASGLS